MKEKPPHDKVSWNNKYSGHHTHRCFYIDGKCKFAFFIDKETDIKIILANFLKCKDFVSLKDYLKPEWDNISLISYFPETNEVFLSSSNKSVIKEKKKAKILADLEEGISVTAGSDNNLKELINKIETEAKIIAEEQKSGKPMIIEIEKINEKKAPKKRERSLL